MCWWPYWPPRWRKQVSHTDTGTWSHPSCVHHHPAPRHQTKRPHPGRTWWLDGKTVMECASNTSHSSLQELALIDWLPALRLNPLWKAPSSGSCYWFDLCSPFLGKRACREAAHTGLTGSLCAATVVLSVLWYADVLWLLVTDYSDCHPALTGTIVFNCFLFKLGARRVDLWFHKSCIIIIVNISIFFACF